MAKSKPEHTLHSIQFHLGFCSNSIRFRFRFLRKLRSTVSRNRLKLDRVSAGRNKSSAKVSGKAGVNPMSVSVKVVEKLSFFDFRFTCSSSSQEIPILRFATRSHQNKRLFSGLCKKMSWESRRCNTSVAMKTKGVVVPAKEEYADDAIIGIKEGKVIAVPTDTLYGFACDACSPEAVNRIYEIKGRKQTSPLAICVGDVLDIEHFAVTDYLPHGLLDNLLPGPVTVVLSRGESSIIEKSLNPGLDSIGVRVPDSNFIRAIARGSRSALALTSANLSGQPSSVCIRDFENLWEHCAYVYDGGLLPLGRAGSTVVDLSVPGKYKILRPGSALEETLSVLQRYSLQKE